jgi:2-methylcitrate dehydratase PrpD
VLWALTIASRRKSAGDWRAVKRRENIAAECSNFGDRLPVESASFINTSMIRNFDFNDRYPGGHPSDCLGALLAMAAPWTSTASACSPA